MITLRNCIGLCCYLALTLSPVLAADSRALLDPDWNDPGVAKARNALERAAGPSGLVKDAEAPLSLPRWGLSSRIDRPTSDEQSLARTALPSASLPAWPSCAKPAADPTPVTDPSGRGLWYTDTYDYGCVVISISGDRSAKPDQSFPAGVTPPDECTDQSASTESDTRGRFDMQLSLNRIPYEIVGRCTDEAEAFCRSRAARCALVERLILRGGRPQ